MRRKETVRRPGRISAFLFGRRFDSMTGSLLCSETQKKRTRPPQRGRWATCHHVAHPIRLLGDRLPRSSPGEASTACRSHAWTAQREPRRGLETGRVAGSTPTIQEDVPQKRKTGFPVAGASSRSILFVERNILPK